MNPEQWYRFGPGHLTLDQLYLLQLRQVSIASYQVIVGIIPAPVLDNTFYLPLAEGFETFALGAYPW